MSRSTTNFAGDTVGQDPTGFTDLSSVWAVQDDSGNVLKNSGNGNIGWDTPALSKNFILRFKVKFVSGTNRWQIQLRRAGALTTSDRIYIGCISADNKIEIYEYISSTAYQRTTASFTYSGWHDVEIVLQDGSIVVRIDSTEIYYDSLTVTAAGVVGPYFNANSSAIIEYDDLDFIAMDCTLSEIKDDNFNDNSLDPQWTVNYGSVTDTLFEETGSELKYSGTPGASGYVFIRSSYTSLRHGWYQELKFKTPTGALGTGTEILFRMEADSNNFVEISCQADGYRVEKVENGSQPSGSIVGPVALFGNENTTFHTLKLLWDEVLDRVWGWIGNSYIGRLSVTTTTFPDQQRFILHLNNTASSAIDRRFDDFVVRIPDTFLYEFVSTAGALAGGSVPFLRGVDKASIGGGLVGGIVDYNRSVSGLMVGGVLSGGVSDCIRDVSSLMSGGVLVGGQSAISSILVQILSVLAQGGVVVGGVSDIASIIVKVLSVIASGGGIVGDSAIIQKLATFLANGGVIIGGNSIFVLPSENFGYQKLRLETRPILAQEGGFSFRSEKMDIPEPSVEGSFDFQKIGIQ